MLEVAKQVAAILNLPVTDDLARVVADYLGRPGLSLLGEADAAAEWLADTQRNRKGQRASPAFFRRWVKRETGTVPPSGAASGRADISTAGARPAPARLAANGTGPPGAPPTRSAADNPYHTFVQQRAAQLSSRHAKPNAEDSEHETHP